MSSAKQNEAYINKTKKPCVFGETKPYYGSVFGKILQNVFFTRSSPNTLLKGFVSPNTLIIFSIFAVIYFVHFVFVSLNTLSLVHPPYLFNLNINDRGLQKTQNSVQFLFNSMFELRIETFCRNQKLV